MEVFGGNACQPVKSYYYSVCICHNQPGELCNTHHDSTINNITVITFRVSRRRREMYVGHARLCVCVPRRIPTLLHRPRCDLGEWQGCPLVVHYWADLQSVHGFRCYDNIARTRNVSECLYSLYTWFSSCFYLFYFYFILFYFILFYFIYLFILFIYCNAVEESN